MFRLPGTLLITQIPKFVSLKPFSMKFLYILSLALLCNCSIRAQQIITHGFMNYTICPDFYSQVERCTGWRQPTMGTSDYFHACAAGTDVGVPQNILGHQSCPDSAYVGLIAYTTSSIPDYKEYIGTTINPLIVGNTYTMSITVSLADTSTYATDGLGVFFTTYPFSDSSIATTVLRTPQVDYSSYGVITDKENWVTLTKTFVADSAYTNITVGCFKSEADITVQTVGPTPDIGAYAYYYISRIGVPDSTRDVVDTTTNVDTTTTNPPPVVLDTVHYGYPTAFTPNGDAQNNIFRIITAQKDKIKGYSLGVYNRWGQRVFITYNIDAGWDGTFNGIPQEIGTYFYMASFTINSEQKVVKGNVTLIR